MSVQAERRRTNPYLDWLDAEVGQPEHRLSPWASPAGGYRSTNLDEWYDRRETVPLRDHRHSAVYRYAWAIPNDEAIGSVAALGPIVEMGAGTGYWAWMLSEAGADVVAYDLWPPTGTCPTEDGDPVSVIVEKARSTDAAWHSNERPWFPVASGSPETLRRHRDRTLLLVWPPYGAPMAAECLRFWRGDALVYVGEDEGGCTADDEFFAILASDFSLTAEEAIPQWDGVHDRLTVWRRLRRPGTRRPLP